MTTKDTDRHDDDYKNDPDDFGAASETAAGGTANHYDGSGLESPPEASPSPSEQHGNNHGSQSEWRKDDDA